VFKFFVRIVIIIILNVIENDTLYTYKWVMFLFYQNTIIIDNSKLCMFFMIKKIILILTMYLNLIPWYMGMSMSLYSWTTVSKFSLSFINSSSSLINELIFRIFQFPITTSIHLNHGLIYLKSWYKLDNQINFI